MARTDEISSTEKLLELIRSKSRKPGAPALAEATRRSNKPASGRRMARRKSVTVGVDIGPSDLKLVAVGPGPDSRASVLNWASMALPADSVKDSARLSAFLHSALSSFCAGIPRPSLWGFLSSASVEIRFLKVPKVPDRQLTNAVLFAFRKEAVFNEKTDIFDYHVIGESDEENATRLRVVAGIAPRQDIETVKRVFAKSGYPLAGLTIVPFALQNLLRADWLGTGQEDVCALFVGRDWSRIAIFSQGILVLSRDIKAGMQSMAETVQQSYETIRHAAVAGEEREEQGPDQVSQAQSEMASAWRMVAAFAGGTDAIGDRDPSLLADEEILSLIRPALDRIVRQVELTFQHYHQNFTGRRVRRLFISGQVCHQPLVANHFMQQLGLDTQLMDPLRGLPKSPECDSFPEDNRVRSNFAPAAGLALADHFSTPNFLYTYQEKAGAKRIRRLDHGVLAVFVLVMVVCIGAYGWMGHQNQAKARIVHDLERRLAGYSPKLDRNLVLTLAGQTAGQARRIEEIAARYRGLSTINEVGRLTPERIRLVNLTLDLGASGGGGKNKKNAYLLLDGLVNGEPLSLDAALVGYVMELANSPIFGAPVIEKRAMERLAGEEVLRFTVRMPLK